MQLEVVIWSKMIWKELLLQVLSRFPPGLDLTLPFSDSLDNHIRQLNRCILYQFHNHQLNLLLIWHRACIQ